MNAGNRITVKGKLVDDQTRCAHYHSPLDIIAIKFKCCNEYYPCFYCHEEEAGHEAARWKTAEFDTKAILCGVCKTELTIQQYLSSHSICPACNAAFNSACRNHHHYYFEP